MKKILSLMVAVVLYLSLFSQVTSVVAESNTFFSKSITSPFTFIQGNRYFKNSNWGGFIFMATTTPIKDPWTEIYVGPTYTFNGRTPQKFIETGFGIGTETADHPWRIASYIFFNDNPDSTGKHLKGRWQGLLDGEYGGTSYWYLGFVTYNVSDKIALGVHGQGFTGVWGPRLQFQTGSFILYGMYGYSLERKETGAMLGVHYGF